MNGEAPTESSSELAVKGLTRVCMSKRRFSRAKLKENVFAYALLLPSLLFLGLFTFYPMLKSLYLSFFETVGSGVQFIGFTQYEQLASDEVFHKVLWNNTLLVIGTVPTSMLLAMYLAIWLNSKWKANSFLRASFFYPTVVPMIAIANIWLFIYTPDYGLIDKFLSLFGLNGENWLGNPDWVMLAIIVMIIWKETGFFMVFYLAGLQNLPHDVYEAAKLEGAKPLQTFRHITFPLLMPTTLFVLIIAVTNSFKLVDHIFIMTKGGPDNGSNLLLYYIYETAFSFLDFGKAAALTVVLLVVLLAISAFNYLYLDKRIHY